MTKRYKIYANSGSLISVLVFLILIIHPVTANAQAVGGGSVEARFGIDGDAEADTARFGNASTSGTKGSGSDDWFKKRSGTGIGVIDTTGAYGVRTILQASIANRQHYVFSRGLSVPKLTRSGNYILLDALYTRDYFEDDSTVILGSSKSADDPTTWTVGLGAPNGKTDILEFGSHVRRKGLTVNDSLFFDFFVSMHDPSGNKNVAAELMVNDVKLDRTTGKLTGTGPNSGRTAWRFDNAGNVTQIGDMIVSMSYAPGSGTFNIEPRIWVSDSFITGGVSAVSPVNFNWGTHFDLVTGGATTYGYQDILPLSGASYSHGVANSSDTTWAGPFGTTSSAASHNWSSHYDANQFIELSMNLTALGVDPSLFSNMDPCSVPYRSILFVSRTSGSGFSSSLSDFAGPYPFWRYPRVVNQIAGTDTLRCNNLTGSIYADSAYSLAWYKWTGTVGGNITGYNADSTVITYNQPGMYIMESAPLRGCWTQKDTVTILGDFLYPVATAFAYDTLVLGWNTQVHLYGGDSTASIAATNSLVFGPSQGILWSWTGKGGFTSTLRNPITADSGFYRLIVTEARNGCTDTAFTTLVTLPLTWGTLECRQEAGGTRLSWYTLQEQQTLAFHIQKWNGRGYESIGSVAAAGNSSVPVFYTWFIPGNSENRDLFRIELEDLNGEREQSEPCITNANAANQVPAYGVKVGPNPGQDYLIIYPGEEAEVGEIAVYSMTGMKQKVTISRDVSNTLQTVEIKNLPVGTYQLRVTVNGSMQTMLIVRK